MPVNRFIVVIILLIVAFLAGFAPQYLKVKSLENDLSAARQENTLAQLRDLAGLAFRSSQPEELWARGWNKRTVFHPYARGDESDAGCKRTQSFGRPVGVSGQDHRGVGEGRPASVGRPSALV